MSKQRRTKSLYSDKTNALTPDLLKQQQIILKIVPDTKIEQTLYRLLVQSQQRYERLLKAHRALQDQLHERTAKRKIHRITNELFKNILK